MCRTFGLPSEVDVLREEMGISIWETQRDRGSDNHTKSAEITSGRMSSVVKY